MSSASLLSARIDRLLRSLVGIADVHLTFGSDGKLRGVAVLREGGMPEHQLVRNVVSGLKAGFGVRIDADAVQVVLHESAWPHRPLEEFRPAADTAEPTTPVVRDVVANRTAAPYAPYTNGNAQHAHGNGAARMAVNGAATNGAHGNGRPHPVVTHDAPIVRESVLHDDASSPLEPQLETIDVERHGTALRCRVTLRVAERTYSAIAEVHNAPTAEAELAARVTLDALRAGGFTTARLDGITLTNIGDTVYVVAAVRPTSSSVPRGGAAPLIRNMASAAAAAVLKAHGPVGTSEPRAARTGTI